MGNSSEILTHLLQHPPASPRPLTFSFLAPNIKGMETAAAILAQHPSAYDTETHRLASTAPHKAHKPALEIAVFAAATEAFSQRNLNCSVADSLARFRAVIAAAKDRSEERRVGKECPV